MFRVFKRLFKVAESEAHSALDHLEDPIKMTEQGIRDLKKDLENSMKNLAQVKAMTIGIKKEQAEKKQIAADYERKAILLLEKGQKGGLDAAEADRLASEALTKKEASLTQATTAAQDLSNQEKMVAQLEANVRKLKSQISQWENELTTLRARAKVAASTKKLNQQLAQIDSNSTVSMLEKMKSKVQEDEALAESYGEMAMIETNVDMEINKALEGEANPQASDSLASLKAKMGINK
tara:strand:- start:123 stop:833 length:711 start_codon:yes stop_codon:yes gene_type:complete